MSGRDDRRFDELLRRELDGELDAEGRAKLDRLCADPARAAERAALARLREDLRGLGARAPRPAADFTARVMRRLASGRRHGLLHTLLRPRLVLVRPVYVLVAALALVLGLAVLLRHGSGPRPRPAPSLLAAPTAPPAALPACAPATVLVRFVLPAPGARTVALAGDFNGWRVGDIMLANAREDGVFTVTVPLQAGASYRYMFVVDGSRWVPDPSAEAYRPDGFGRQNSLLRL